MATAIVWMTHGIPMNSVETKTWHKSSRPRSINITSPTQSAISWLADSSATTSKTASPRNTASTPWCKSQASTGKAVQALWKYPSLSPRLTKVYFACLKKDPLYGYTKKTVEEYCVAFFKGVFHPLLEYCASRYGPPRRLDDSPCPPFNPNCVRVAGRFWIYTCKDDRNVKESRLLQYMGGVVQVPGIRTGVTCTLNVVVPSNPNDRYWNRMYPQFHWEGSKEDEGTKFLVKAWGPDANYATFYATRIAEDFIKTVRNRLNNESQSNSAVIQHVPQGIQATMCLVLHIGAYLNKHWRFGSSFFSLSGLTAEKGLSTNAKSIISDLCKRYSYPFLRYYLVTHSPEGLIVDLPAYDSGGIRRCGGDHDLSPYRVVEGRHAR